MILAALALMWAFTWTTSDLKPHTSPWYTSKKTCNEVREAFIRETGVQPTLCEPVGVRREE